MMSSYTGNDFNDLAKSLFDALSKSNPNFNSEFYLNKFESQKTNADKVNFVYKDIKKYSNTFAKFMSDIKDDTLALEHVDSGKRKINAGNYWGALEDFTRSIATGKSDEVVALAYGYRSECFFNLKMPVRCITEINRALLHYPKDIIGALIDRKKEAENMDSAIKDYYETVPKLSNEENGLCSTQDNVRLQQNELFGKHIIATKDIEIGEIISIEEPFTSVLTSERTTHCHECLKLCYNPIPCNSCTVVLFCSENCRDKARPYHRYECPILLTICYRILCEFTIDDSILLALKVALLATDCDSQKRTLQLKGSDKCVKAHFLKSGTTFTTQDLLHHAITTVLVFELLLNHTSFFSEFFSDGDSFNKFKEVMFLQLQHTATNAARIYEYVCKSNFNGTTNFGVGAYSYFSLYTHSCCANVMKTYHGNAMVLRALNTIRQGDQCFVNRYGLRYDTLSTASRRQFLRNHKLERCVCKACQGDWSANLGDFQQICEDLHIDQMPIGDIVKNVIGNNANKAAEFLPAMAKLLKECEQLEPIGNALALKSLIVHCYVILGNRKIEVDESKQNFFFVP